MPLWGHGWHLDEYFADERLRASTPVGTRRQRKTAQPAAAYSLRVARRQNVVVVIEAKETDDRNEFVLSVAMARATGDHREQDIFSATGDGLDGW